jgi:hypothetical protein
MLSVFSVMISRDCLTIHKDNTHLWTLSDDGNGLDFPQVTELTIMVVAFCCVLTIADYKFLYRISNPTDSSLRVTALAFVNGLVVIVLTESICVIVVPISGSHAVM